MVGFKPPRWTPGGPLGQLLKKVLGSYPSTLGHCLGHLGVATAAVQQTAAAAMRAIALAAVRLPATAVVLVPALAAVRAAAAIGVGAAVAVAVGVATAACNTPTAVVHEGAAAAVGPRHASAD